MISNGVFNWVGVGGSYANSVNVLMMLLVNPLINRNWIFDMKQFMPKKVQMRTPEQVAAQGRVSLREDFWGARRSETITRIMYQERKFVLENQGRVQGGWWHGCRQNCSLYRICDLDAPIPWWDFGGSS